MTDKAERPRTPIPKPPSHAELDQLSEDQAMITDEWGDAPPDAAKVEKPGPAR